MIMIFECQKPVLTGLVRLLLVSHFQSSLIFMTNASGLPLPFKVGSGLNLKYETRVEKIVSDKYLYLPRYRINIAFKKSWYLCKNI